MEITPYDFSGKTVRMAMDENGDPIWVGRDACFALGLSKYRDVLSNLDDDERVYITMDTPGGPQRMIAINEPGLYSLLTRSNKKRAKKFRRWVFHDVLPTLRKTGSYAIGYQLPQTFPEALRALASKVEENQVLKPKARVYDLIASSKGLVCISDCANILQIPPHKFSADLIRDGYCHKRRGKHVAYVQYRNMGWFEMKLVHARDGSGHSYRQTFITPLGVAKFREIYNPKQAQRRLFA